MRALLFPCLPIFHYFSYTLFCSTLLIWDSVFKSVRINVTDVSAQKTCFSRGNIRYIHVYLEHAVSRNISRTVPVMWSTEVMAVILHVKRTFS
jgi:hypothetical protein